jgi:hypothetical protein
MTDSSLARRGITYTTVAETVGAALPCQPVALSVYRPANSLPSIPGWADIGIIMHLLLPRTGKRILEASPG